MPTNFKIDRTVNGQYQLQAAINEILSQSKVTPVECTCSSMASGLIAAGIKLAELIKEYRGKGGQELIEELKRLRDLPDQFYDKRSLLVEYGQRDPHPCDLKRACQLVGEISHWPNCVQEYGIKHNWFEGTCPIQQMYCGSNHCDHCSENRAAACCK